MGVPQVGGGIVAAGLRSVGQKKPAGARLRGALRVESARATEQLLAFPRRGHEDREILALVASVQECVCVRSGRCARRPVLWRSIG